MLTAVESFLTMEKQPAKKAKKAQHEEEDNINNDPSSKKKTKTDNVNQTMASFFAPLPVISLSSSNDITLQEDEKYPPLIASHQGFTTTDKPKALTSSKNGDVWFVARYGRIYKRKAPSKTGYAHISCPPGHRYCKECQKPLPLDKFYTNVKRYICKHHHYLRVNKRFKERVMASDYERMAEMAWLDLFRICPVLGYAKADYDRHDIKDLVINTKIPLSVLPRAVPIDPSIPMRPRNVAILSSGNMGLLIKVYMLSCSRAQYILLVQSCNLIPPNADAGVPWAPYHNPDYMREDYDVGAILEKESKMPKELPHVEAVMEMMKADESKINDCKARLGRDEL